MTYSKLPGVYFSETVSTIADETSLDEVLTFIVQTSTAIASIDDKLTLFDSYDAFATVAADKGLPNTLAFINNVLAATGHTKFYVYSIKTDTSAGFQEAVNSSSQYKENQKFIYFEETKSASNNSIATKASALAGACHTCYEYGAFRTAYVIPYGTITDAVANKESGVTSETAVVTAFTSILSGSGDGRLVMIMPDGYDAIMSTIINAGYTVDAGNPIVSGSVGTLTYNFSRTQMTTLQNLGVCFLRPERVNGEYEYHVNVGVTTSFKSSAADGLIVARLRTDELLRCSDVALKPFILEGEAESNVSFAQTAIDNVVDEFVAEGYAVSDGTKLTVAAAGSMTFIVTGTIQTVKSLIAIEVSATIS